MIFFSSQNIKALLEIFVRKYGVFFFDLFRKYGTFFSYILNSGNIYSHFSFTNLICKITFSGAFSI